MPPLDDEVVEDLEIKESQLHQLLRLKKNYWSAKRRKMQILRRADIQKVEKMIKEMRDQREKRRASGDSPDLRRRRRNRRVDRPRRSIDRCWGCARPFHSERIRLWTRCESCGLWLCPDCSANPVHCQDEPFAG